MVGVNFRVHVSSSARTTYLLMLTSLGDGRLVNGNLGLGNFVDFVVAGRRVCVGRWLRSGRRGLFALNLFHFLRSAMSVASHMKIGVK